MVSIKNLTPGILCVDIPSDAEQRGADPVADILRSVDLSREISPGDAVKLLIGMEVGRRAEVQLAREMSAAAARRAANTVDLFPTYRGEGQPPHVNMVDDEAWAKIKNLPAVAARLASGQLVVGERAAIRF